jgi:BCCT, betaine/carnitine/choline family transporter
VELALDRPDKQWSYSSLAAPTLTTPIHTLVYGTTNCFHVPQHNVITDGEVIFHNYLTGITPVCMFNPAQDIRSLFNVLQSFSLPGALKFGFGTTLSVITIFAIAMFVITSVDSAALVMHYLSSNGKTIYRS